MTDLFIDSVLDRNMFPVFSQLPGNVLLWLRKKSEAETNGFWVHSGETREVTTVSEYLQRKENIMRDQAFNPVESYAASVDYTVPTIDPKTRASEMSRISNLLTDMIISKADEDELMRLVHHAMVLVESRVYNLDWKKSEKDHDIDGLMEKYSVNPRRNKQLIEDALEGFEVD